MNTKKLAEVAVVTGASKGICATIVRLMKRSNLIHLIERFQTQHALGGARNEQFPRVDEWRRGRSKLYPLTNHSKTPSQRKSKS